MKPEASNNTQPLKSEEPQTVNGTRFVKTSVDGQTLDETALARALRVVGLKGCVTNIPTRIMPPSEVIQKYHNLWQVEQSFRISKTDLRARPMLHHNRDAIEAHLTVVFTALAMARYLEAQTGFSIRKIIRTVRPLQDITRSNNGHPTPPETPSRQMPGTSSPTSTPNTRPQKSMGHYVRPYGLLRQFVRSLLPYDHS